MRACHARKQQGGRSPSRSVQGVIETGLARVQSEYAEHRSWLHRERGDHAGARRWADKATSWALEADDPVMASYMMLRRASLALALALAWNNKIAKGVRATYRRSRRSVHRLAQKTA